MISRIVSILSILYSIGALVFHYYVSPVLDTKAIVGSTMLGVGGAGYMFYDYGSSFLNRFKMKSKEVKNPVGDEKPDLEYLNDARVHIDALMKIGLDNQNETITKSMIELNTEVFKIYHK